MTNIGIRAQIGMDGRGFQLGLMNAERALGHFAARAARKLAGIFTVGAAIHFARDAIENARRIRDMAINAGVTTEKFQELEYAAKQTGTEIEAISRGFAFLTKAQKQALGGSDEFIKAFKSIGLGMEDIKRPADELFSVIAGGFATGKLGFKDVDAIKKLMGRGAQSLIAPMTGGLERFAEEARKLGIIIKDETVQSLATLADKLTDIQLKFMLLVSEAIPPIVKAVKEMVHLLMQAFAYLKAATIEMNKSTEATGKEGVVGYGFEGKPRTAVGWSIPASAWKRAHQKGMEALNAMAEQQVNWDAENKELNALRVATANARAAMNREAAISQLEAIKPEAAKEFKIPSDELARIGGFIGGAGNRPIDIAKQQLSELKAIKSDLRRVAGVAENGL